MANKPLKTLNFGGEDTYVLTPEWENIDNKPFGETTVMGDTLTWDGNTDGLYNVMSMFYKVSDVIPTLAELQQGGSVTAEVNGTSTTVLFTSENVIDVSVAGMGTDLIMVNVSDLGVLIATKDGATMSMEDAGTLEFGKAGIYFYNVEGGYIVGKSLTINNYTGFECTKVVPLDNKYLGILEEKLSDTIYRPADTSSLDKFESDYSASNCKNVVFYRVSDKAIPASMLVVGEIFIPIRYGGSSALFSPNSNQIISHSNGIVEIKQNQDMEDMVCNVCIVPEEAVGNSLYGVELTLAGVYFVDYYDGGGTHQVTSLKVTGQAITTAQTIKAEHIPKEVILEVVQELIG